MSLRNTFTSFSPPPPRDPRYLPLPGDVTGAPTEPASPRSTLTGPLRRVVALDRPRWGGAQIVYRVHDPEIHGRAWDDETGRMGPEWGPEVRRPLDGPVGWRALHGVESRSAAQARAGGAS